MRNLGGEVDIQVVDRGENDEKGAQQLELIAHLAAGLLSKHYPNHLWMVGWAPGAVLVIKNMAMDSRYGYTVDAGKAATSSELEKAIVMGGGELLERMGLKRGAWDGTVPLNVEGIPSSFLQKLLGGKT